MNFKDKLIIYLYNRQNAIEEEFDNTIQNVRFKRNDEVDYLECIIAKSRKDLVNEIIGDIMNILSLGRK